MNAILTPAEYSQALKTRLVDAYDQWATLHGCISRLTSTHCTRLDSCPPISQVAQQSILRYLSGICSDLSKCFQGSTKQTFELKDLKFNEGAYTHYRVYEKVSVLRPETFIESIDGIISTFDFKGFVQQLYKHTGSLEDKGKLNAADYLTTKLGLSSHHRDDCIKRTSRHILLQISHRFCTYIDKYDYSNRECYHQTLSHLKLVAEETGCFGFAIAFQEFFNATDDKIISSGTAFGNKNTVEIKVYKGHIKINLVPDVFDALVSFLVIYGTEPLKQIEELA